MMMMTVDGAQMTGDCALPIGLAFERYVSDDLNRKMTDNYKEEPKLRYESILHGVLLNNEVS
jgi:hypothetical protein